MHAFFVAFICQLDELTWVQLSSILDFFLFWFWKLQKCQKKLGLNHHLSTYFELKGYYIHSRDNSKFWSKTKTSKSRELLLSCTQVNSSSRQIIATHGVKGDLIWEGILNLVPNPINNVPITFCQLFNLWIYVICCLRMEADGTFFSYLTSVYNLHF